MNNWQTTPGELRITDKDAVPFMAEKEYYYIRDLINEKKYKTVLEWGAGASTIWFPQQCPQTIWIAIESDPVYYEYLKPRVPQNVRIFLNATHDGYLDIIEKYDFILIDGLYRDECLKKAFDLLNEDGSIILHDSGRKAYHDWYKDYKHEIIFEGEGWLGDGWDHRGIALFKCQ